MRVIFKERQEKDLNIDPSSERAAALSRLPPFPPAEEEAVVAAAVQGTQMSASKCKHAFTPHGNLELHLYPFDSTNKNNKEQSKHLLGFDEPSFVQSLSLFGSSREGKVFFSGFPPVRRT